MPGQQIAGAYRKLLNDPKSETAQEAGGDGWSRTEHLLAMVVDELRLANWQRTKEGSKNRNRPKPISPLAPKGRRIGKTNKSFAEVKDYLDRLHRRGRWQPK